MNSLFAIAPYQFEDFWVFDDPGVGLRQEPFVCGMDHIIDVMTEDMPDAGSGFKLLFSSRPFPGFTAKLEWLREECGGNWYAWRKYALEGWLCPALFKYFDTAPKEIFLQASPK